MRRFKGYEWGLGDSKIQSLGKKVQPAYVSKKCLGKQEKNNARFLPWKPSRGKMYLE